MRGSVGETILFDLDGTLTDPVSGMTASLSHAFVKLGRPVPAEQTLRRCIGPPLADSFTALLRTSSPELVAAAIAAYREHYAERGLYDCRLHTGIPELLDTLSRRGFALHVVTAKPAVYARRVIEHVGLAHHFAGVHGPELSGERSDKRELLAHVLEEQGIAASRAWMVGDREHDVVAAAGSGVTSVGVLWGIGSEEELSRAGASHIIEAPEQIIGLLPGEARV